MVVPRERNSRGRVKREVVREGYVKWLLKEKKKKKRYEKTLLKAAYFIKVLISKYKF